jgi:hypothetical protein
MAIKDLYNDPDSFKYNSKSLKYTGDIRGGGSSGQPWIKAPVPDTIDQLNSSTTEALSLDYPIRGGSYEELAAETDFARIDRFLLSYPYGKAFLDKQAGLNLSNPLMESRMQGGRPNTMEYSNGVNLMKQIAEGGTGFRYPQAGLNENELGYVENTYGYLVSRKPTQQNRLVALYNFKVNPDPIDEFTGGIIARDLGINDTIDSELFFYQNGPGSLYGLGSTTIRVATDARNAPILTKNAPKATGPYLRTNINSEDVQARPVVKYNYYNTLGLSRFFGLSTEITGITEDNTIQNVYPQESKDFIRVEKLPEVSTTTQYTQLGYTMGYTTLLNQKLQGETNSSLPSEDFRKNVLEPQKVFSRDYRNRNVNIATRVGIGNPGSPLLDRTDIANTNPTTQDKVNMSPLVTRGNDVPVENDGEVRDLIKFAFETLSNNNDITTRAHFRAFLTGFSDSHSAQWDSKRYAGRGENFYTYQGFDRDVSFNFKIAPQSRPELKVLYQKFNFLVSSLYPDYTGNGFMRGNITKLTIGEYFYRVPGIITGLNITVNDEYPWEIKMTQPEDGADVDMMELPQILDVAVSFKPILDVLPKKGRKVPIIMTNQVKNNFLSQTF